MSSAALSSGSQRLANETTEVDGKERKKDRKGRKKKKKRTKSKWNSCFDNSDR